LQGKQVGYSSSAGADTDATAGAVFVLEIAKQGKQVGYSSSAGADAIELTAVICSAKRATIKNFLVMWKFLLAVSLVKPRPE
jgi:hypothetical protein